MYDISDTWRTCAIRIESPDDLPAAKAALRVDLDQQYKRVLAEYNQVMSAKLALATDSLDIVECEQIE